MRYYIAFSCVLFFCWGCDTRPPVPAPPKEPFDARSFFLSFNAEAIPLLAVKYGITQAVTEDILATYEERHSVWGLSGNQTIGPSSDPNSIYYSVKDTLDGLSKKHGIRTEIIADLIITSIMMQNVEE
jgi:hypothetical protein